MSFGAVALYGLFFLFVLTGLFRIIYHGKLQRYIRSRYPVAWEKLYQPNDVVFSRMDTRGNAWSVRQSIKSNTELSADAHLKRQADLFMRIEITFILSTVMLILLLFSYIVR